MMATMKVAREICKNNTESKSETKCPPWKNWLGWKRLVSELGRRSMNRRKQLSRIKASSGRDKGTILELEQNG